MLKRNIGTRRTHSHNPPKLGLKRHIKPKRPPIKKTLCALSTPYTQSIAPLSTDSHRISAEPSTDDSQVTKPHQKYLKRLRGALFQQHANTSHFYPPELTPSDISAIELAAEQPMTTFSMKELTKLHPTLSSAYISATFLRKELKIRYAQRILLLRDLPFSICRHPLIQQIQLHYLNSFNLVSNTKEEINNIDDLHQFNQIVLKLLESSTAYPSSVISHAMAISFTDLLLSQLAITDENIDISPRTGPFVNNTIPIPQGEIISALLDDDQTLITLFSSVLQESSDMFNVSRFDARLIIAQHLQFNVQLFDLLNIKYSYKLFVNTLDPVINDEFGSIIVHEESTSTSSSSESDDDIYSLQFESVQQEGGLSLQSQAPVSSESKPLPSNEFLSSASSDAEIQPSSGWKTKAYTPKTGFDGFVGIIELECSVAAAVAAVIPHAIAQSVIRSVDSLITEHGDMPKIEPKKMNASSDPHAFDNRITHTVNYHHISQQWIKHAQRSLHYQLTQNEPHPILSHYKTAKLSLPDVSYRGYTVPVPTFRITGDLDSTILAPKPQLNTILHELISNSVESTISHVFNSNSAETPGIHKYHHSLTHQPSDVYRECGLTLLNDYAKMVQDDEDTTRKEDPNVVHWNMVPPSDFKVVGKDDLLLPPISVYLALDAKTPDHKSQPDSASANIDPSILKQSPTTPDKKDHSQLTVKISDLANGLSKQRAQYILTYATTIIDQTLHTIKQFRGLMAQYNKDCETEYATFLSQNYPPSVKFQPPPYPQELKQLVKQLPSLDKYTPTSLKEMCQGPTPRKYGLPLAKCLANYLQYELSINSVQGLSTNVVLKMKL